MPRSATATRAAFVACAVASVASVAHAQRPNQGEDESAALVDEGRAALRRGDLADADKALEQAINLNPRRVEAYVLRSAVFAARKRYSEGVVLMRQAQALAPTDPDVLTALGSQLVLSGEIDAGIPLLEQVVAKEPARYDAQLLLGHHWHDTGRWQETITALEAYFAHRPGVLAREDAQHRVDLGDAYLRHHQAAKALTIFDAASTGRASPGTQLRAKLGAAWATAALDCKKARGVLHDLEPVAEQHPEVWLVDGQCALALGDINGALSLGRKYLERAPKGSAAGHALVGEAQAARGNLNEARHELETARQLEPARRRWTVRLAYVLRRGNHLTEALAALDQLGPPSSPPIDPDWWLELGELLLARGDAKGVVAKLSPIVPELPGDAAIRTVFGAALLAIGQGEAAIRALDEAEAVQHTPRSKKLLVEALATVGAAKLSVNDAAAAEPLLARADQLEGSAIIWRDLGIARLALDKPAEAVPVLDRAVKADGSQILAMLDARAHVLAGDLATARPIYERALGAEKDNAIEISIDWAASEVASGDPAIAVTALEKTAQAARTGPLAARHKAALATARHAAALSSLRAGNGIKALELLRASVTADSTLLRRCDLAVAAVASGDTNAALTALKTVAGQTCPFPPPADVQAVPILIAFSEGLTPKRAAKALDRLTSLGGKASGAAANLLGTAIRVVALNAAQDAYHDGQLAQARKYLATAKAAVAHVGADEVAHNLAVLDLADGRIDSAIQQLERLTPKVPEAWVNLGIAYERKGDHPKALDAWRRARKLNVRFAQLPEWLDAKERVYGGVP